MRIFNSLPFKFIPGVLLVCLLLMAGTCKKKNKDGSNPVAIMLQKTWLHSHEEDRGDTLVYRPNSYDFPPARGRTGFILEANGVFRQYDIAPTDGLEEHPGHWEMRDDKFLDVTFPDKRSTDFQVEIISMTADKLKVKKTYKSD